MRIQIACFLLLATGCIGVRPKIDPSLNKVLQSKDSANVIISMKEGTADILNSFSRRTFNTREEKLSALKSTLTNHATESQAPVVKILQSEFPAVDFQSFWISNQVYIKGASLGLIQKLSQIPSISTIEEEVEVELMMPLVESLDIFGNAPNLAEWSVSLIQAPEAWGLDGGNNGENVIIATIDTGVRVTHEALKGNFLGDFGWYDPYKLTTSPNDQNGHGTHVTGTIAGQGGIGVAPGAKWMACKGCATSSCALSALIKCGQFMVCPTDPSGEQQDCSKAPHVVSNSWGGGQGRPDYHKVIDTWIAAGIIPVFANGNSGPRCGSANSPADYKGAIGVGSTTRDDTLSSFSSVGPSVSGGIKPDVSAPGSSIRSSYHTSDNAYATLSGTSMACPHAAGVIALLKGRDQELSIDFITKHLFKGIHRDVTPTGQNCGGVSEDTWPNNAFGHGRVNAFKALVSLLEDLEQ